MNQGYSSPIGQRIPDDCWINHPWASEACRYLLDLIEEPNKFRPRGCLIVGHPDNGKSFLLRRVAGLVSDHVKSSGLTLEISSVRMDAPVQANRRDLYRKLETGLRLPFDARLPWDILRQQVTKAIADSGAKVIFVDELQHLIAGGDLKKRTIMDDLKTWSHDSGIPVIAAGTEKAALVVETDDQYWDRLRPMEVPLWRLDENYLGLLGAFERVMKVPSGSFTNSKSSELIWKHSEMLIGRTVYVLNQALKIAQQSGSPSITDRHLNAAGFGHLTFLKLRPKR